VDLAEGKNRTVLSGLAEHIPIEQLQNRLVILCTNLPPRKCVHRLCDSSMRLNL
jgi:aminoacyl tRNA synthase complex-interacting multifunctional protein 1